MPSVKKGQSQSDYINECVPYVVKNEGLTQKQALGKCYGLWQSHKKKSKAYPMLEHLAEELLKKKD